MALRPGTTATRAESALIERAISSAQSDHARRFDAGRGFEFVQRHHRAGMGLDDFAADAEIAEHAFQRARIGIELRLAERLAVGCLRRGQHRNRRQLEPVGRFARRRARSGLLARRAGGRLVFFLLLLLLLLVAFGFVDSSSARGASDGPARPRLGSWRSNESCARRRRAGDQRAVGQGQQPPQPRLRAHHGVKRPSQRDRSRRHRLPRTACRRPRSRVIRRPAGANPCRSRTGMSRSAAANSRVPSTRR